MSNSSASLAPAQSAGVPLWAWAIAAFALFAVYFLVQENGAILSADAATWLHEVTHDGRHALGVPCH